MEPQTIAITLDKRAFFGMSNPDFAIVNEEAGGVLPEVIGMALCAGVTDNDPFEFDDFIWQLLTYHQLEYEDIDLLKKTIRYVAQCVRNCQPFMPDAGFCEFEHLYVTHDANVVLIVRYFPIEK